MNLRGPITDIIKHEHHVGKLPTAEVARVGL